MPQLFKRNNYETFVIGKEQPMDGLMGSADKKQTDFYFIEGTPFWGVDRSFTSSSYCCVPGGGYFVDGVAQLGGLKQMALPKRC